MASTFDTSPELDVGAGANAGTRQSSGIVGITFSLRMRLAQKHKRPKRQRHRFFRYSCLAAYAAVYEKIDQDGTDPMV